MSAMISISGKNAAGIIAVSQNTFNDVARFYPHLKNKTKVIYSGNKFNAEDYVYYKPLDQFLFVGTIEPGKNLSTVLKALSIFNQGSKKTKLKVIGAQGWKQSHLFQLIKDLGLIDSVIFCGYASDEQLKKEYQSSIALICASLYEGFGLPVIEAMACGCPVIAANNSSLPEAGAECAMYFETENEKDLAEKMLLLTVHPEMTNNNIQAGLVHASKFTWEKTARQTCELYWEIVGKKGEKS
jgi:glycosyltransferase involved in cell wall biosynthesis